MKIIQSSNRLKQKGASKSGSTPEVDNREITYKEVDTDLLSQKAKLQSNKTSKPKSNVKSEPKRWRSGSKTKHTGLSPENDQTEEEFDFDTSNLKAMPKEGVAEPIPTGKKRRRSELIAEKACEPVELTTDPAKKEFNEFFARGIRLLAMREHSVKEITKKLFDKSKGTDNADGSYDADGSDSAGCSATIYAVIDELLEQKYLSDERFAESYIRARGNRGFGPVKIRAELKAKGVSNSLIQDYLNEGAALWFDNAKSQYQKKYGDAPISDYNAWTKRARFMQSRGFTMEHIHVTVPRVEFD